ncbi:MAG: YfiR family protein [Pseudomonadota bacterium]
MQIQKKVLLSTWIGVALSLAPSAVVALDRTAIEVFIYHLARMSSTPPPDQSSKTPDQSSKTVETTSSADDVAGVGEAGGGEVETATPPVETVNEYHVCFSEGNKRGARIRNLEGRNVKGSVIRLKELEKIDHLVSTCRMLLVSRREEKDIDAMMLAKDGILTIGTTPRFARAGGTFFVDDLGSKVSFEINFKAATAAGLRPNAKLLQLASEVYDE